jgi:hypothetical protein
MANGGGVNNDIELYALSVPEHEYKFDNSAIGKYTDTSVNNMQTGKNMVYYVMQIAPKDELMELRPLGYRSGISTKFKFVKEYGYMPLKGNKMANGGSMEMARGGAIKVGDRVRSTMYKGYSGTILSTSSNKDYWFVELDKKLPNGDIQHDVFHKDEVEKIGKGDSMANGGGVDKMMIKSFDAQSLVGRWLTFVGYGEQDLKITHARVTPEHFTNRDLIITTTGGGTNVIPFAQAQDFINGETVELRDSKGEYFTLKLIKEMFAKGGLTESQQNKFDKVMHEFKEGELHWGRTDKVVTDKKQAVAIAFAQANKLAMGGYVNQEQDKIMGVYRTDQTDVFINSDIYRTEADYIIGGFLTYQLNSIAVGNDVTVLSMPKIKHLVKKRIIAAIESLKTEISSKAISSESQFNSYEINEDYNNEIVNLFETYLECRPESINTNKLAEQIMNDSAFLVWESKIEERVMRMKTQIRYQLNDVNKLKGSNISVKEAEDLTYSTTLEQMLEQLRNIIEVNEN